LTAQAAGIEGTVVLKGIVNIDGHLIHLQVVSGRQELRQAALDCAARWIVHPYTDQFGNFTPTETRVNVVFTLGNKQEKAKAMAKAQAELAKEAASPSGTNPPAPASHP
jgi:TonB family protein